MKVQPAEEFIEIGCRLVADDLLGVAYQHATKALVSVTATLSCGCRWRRSEPMRVAEPVKVGTMRICDRCDDYAMVTRVTTRLDGGVS